MASWQHTLELSHDETLTSYSEELVKKAGSVPNAEDREGKGSPAPTNNDGLLDDRKEEASPEVLLSLDVLLPLSALAKMSSTLVLEAVLLWGSRVAK
jgi:hypothetical protein